MEMKAQFRPNHLWDYIFSVFLITFHIHPGLCRPPQGHVDVRIVLQNDSQDALGHLSPHSQRQQVMPAYGLSSRDVTGLRDDDDGVPLSYSHKDLIDYLSTSSADVSGDVMRSLRELADRNLVRKRRHQEGGRRPPHRRRRRKHHRLVLKARAGAEDNQLPAAGRDRHHVIRSDSPGYVITSASEVKKDWCKTIPLRHKVHEAGCRSRTVQNNFCYGQCNSFFIPHSGRTGGEVAFQSCAVCKPARQHLANVTLNCPGRSPPKVLKTVLFVDECRCASGVLK